MLGVKGSNNFMTLARHATEADIRSIPYAGDAVWRDVKLMRTALLNKEALLAKPHIRKILKHSGTYITNMCAYYNQSLAASNNTDEEANESNSVIKDTAGEAVKDTNKNIKDATMDYWKDSPTGNLGLNTEDTNETDGFAMVEVDETEKTKEIDDIVNALEGLTIKNLRTIKSLIKNVDWQ